MSYRWASFARLLLYTSSEADWKDNIKVGSFLFITQLFEVSSHILVHSFLDGLIFSLFLLTFSHKIIDSLILWSIRRIYRYVLHKLYSFSWNLLTFWQGTHSHSSKWNTFISSRGKITFFSNIILFLPHSYISRHWWSLLKLIFWTLDWILGCSIFRFPSKVESSEDLLPFLSFSQITIELPPRKCIHWNLFDLSFHVPYSFFQIFPFLQLF